MCELFAMSSSENRKINDLLKEFFSHSVDNPHGWGMALFYDRNAVSLEKEPHDASKSRYLKDRLSHDLVISNMMAHIRYATVGVTDYSNTHPFVYRDRTGRNWTMEHNGTIFDYEPLGRYVFRQEGTTDSERILMYIIERINEAEKHSGGRLSREERFHIVDDIVCDMSKGNKLNLILYDSSIMYVHTNYKNSLYYCEDDESVMFCTKPLSKGDWKPVPFTQLLGFRNGKLRLQGTVHGNEYIDNPDDIQMLYRDFSNL